MTCIFFKTTVCKSLVSVCSIPSLSEQLQEVRSQAEVCLYSGGRVVDVRARVMAMAVLPLPPCSKYQHVSAETMVIENSSGSNRKEVTKHTINTEYPVNTSVTRTRLSHGENTAKQK